jgi:curved DNA-binding protein CbpA
VTDIEIPPLDLYAVMGLERAACPTDGEIRAAFRRHSMTIHPDHGGGREQFEQLQLAYQVLSDPVRRRRYDSNGDTSDPRSHKNENHQALLAIIENLVSQAIEGDVDLATRDPLTFLRKAVADKLGEILRQRKATARKITRTEQLLARTQKKAKKKALRLSLHAPPPEVDLFDQVARKRLAIQRSEIEDLDRMRNIWADMGELLNEYTYRVDVPERSERPMIPSGILRPNDRRGYW